MPSPLIRPPKGAEKFPYKWMKWHNHIIPLNKVLGIGVDFLIEIQNRINKRLSTKIIVVGDAGIGKTYLAIDLAMVFDKTFKIEPPPSQVIFYHEDYMALTNILKEGKWIVLDEPSYVIGHREWYNEINRILVQTMESDRFAVHPLIIPIINQALLDKVIRQHLLQYMIWVTDRGKGRVYGIRHSHFVDKVYYDYKCDLIMLAPKIQLHSCGRTACLGCKSLILVISSSGLSMRG